MVKERGQNVIPSWSFLQMEMRRSSLTLLLVFIALPCLLLGEGTPSIWKNYSGVALADESGGLVVNFRSDPVNGHYPSYNYSTDSLSRLYVHIDDHTSEIINFGFNVRRLWFQGCSSGSATGNYSNTNISNGNVVHWRLVDPSGTVVMADSIPAYNGGTTTSTTTGYIGTYSEANNGPDGIDGVTTAGYTPATYNPSATGDYYFEFNYGDSATAFDASSCSWASIEFQYFDITVSESSNSIDGRVWSRLWALSTINRSPAEAIAINSSKVHVYTDDSIVTRVDFDTISPGFWNIFANEDGVGSSGTFELDSRSDNSPATQLQRKNRVFLNTPDTNVYPTRALTRTVSPVYVMKCDDGDQCIMVDLNRPSEVSIYIEVNGVAGYQTSSTDVLLQGVNASRGLNCVPWDGLDGNGDPLSEGDTIYIQVIFDSDVTQLPLQDMESNPNGLKISLELPISGSTAAYWNDTLVGGGFDLTGCVSSASSGCHSWTGSFSSGIGNGNVINTYWYSTLDTLVPIVYTDSTFAVDFAEDTLDAACGDNDTITPAGINVTAFHGPPATDFRWTTSGGGTFSPHDSTLNASYIPSADELQYGGTLKLFIAAREGCPDVKDSLVVDFGKRPGGVDNGLYSWLKANDGPLNSGTTAATDGQNVAVWTDLTNAGNDANAVTTGAEFDVNVFNNNPALLFTDDAADRFTIGLDQDYTVNGTGSFVAGSSTGINNGSFSTGDPDNDFAEVFETADELVIDLGRTLPVGTDYVLTWRRKSSYSFGPTADMVVEESTSPGSGYSTNSATPQTTSITTAVTTTMTTENSTRYIRLSQLTGTNDDFEFDGVTYSLDLQRNETFYIVADKSNNTNNTYYGDNSSANLRRLYGTGTNNPIWRPNGSGTTVNSSTTIANDQAFIAATQVSGAANERFWVNGTSMYDSEFGSMPESSTLILGDNSALSNPLGGNISEVLIFNTALNQSERRRVNSYLAIKYGITLTHDYYDAKGALLINSDGSGGTYTYDNDIGVIGQNQCRMSMSQPKSMSQHSDAVVQMSNPSSLDDFDYLAWGNDNGALTAEDSTDVNSYYFTHRVDRIWRVDTTGSIGSVTVGFYLGNISVGTNTVSDYGLVISNSATMANGWITNYTHAISNDTLYFYEVTFDDDQFFTLATRLADFDGDGIGDVYDIDDDDDGIPDTLEFGAGTDPDLDSDDDGTPDYADADTPGCGTLSGGVCSNYDTDGDGNPDHRDLDADNDGIPDIVEAGGVDTDGDGRIDNTTDTDGDGLNDPYDPSTGGDAISNPDTDGDGVSDYLDLDADNDGIPDVVEAGGTDTDGDGYFDDQTDTDGDGFADDVDGDVGNDGTAENSGDALQITGADTDADGIPNSYPNDDTDGDGIRDQLDLDADNDGIPDVVEAGGTDTDGDGIFDDQTDTDGDGFADDVDGDVGNDGTAENSGDALQLTGSDTDNDGEPNSYPNDDTDGDGIRDQLDLDADNDGIPDVVEAGGTDTDGDGIFDDQTDTDGDGFADDVDGDVGNDGTAENSADALQLTGSDTDNDGEPNSYPNDDTDGDGIRDQLDLDADNDGIPDVVEAGGTDTDGDGIFDDQTDTDNDGFADDVDGDVGNDGTAENSGDALQLTGSDTDNDGEPNSYPNDDTDGDGIRDQLDLDADNDGIPDVVEAGGTDTDGDGYFDDQTDTDGDGFADDVDGDVGNDGTAENSGDALQLTGSDTDNDGEPNSYPNDDTDGDGIRDQLDLDADNDGIQDVVEAGGTDTDGDGIFDDQTDSDNDGFADDVDGDVGNDGTAENSADALQLTGSDTDNDGEPNSYPNDDTDSDGIRDQLDLDADNDGIPDVVEAGGTDTDGDGIFDDQTDTDNDGFADDVDGDVGNDGTAENSGDALQITGSDTDNDGAPNSVPSDDFDGDGIPSQLDIDADDDGIVDVREVFGTDANQDGRVDGFGTDTDGDGFADSVDGDVGNDGTAENTANALVVTGSDTDNDGAPNSYPNKDSDGDGLTDQIDIDADNDGIVDNSEAQATASYISPSGSDTDGDGLDNAYDPDNSGTYQVPVDTDSDTTADYLDSDTDDDGESDLIEGHDSDGDGVADSGSPANTGVSGGSTDSDGDGLLDGFDNNTSSRDPTNSSLNPSSHPDEDGGASERDWREVPCASGTVILAPDNVTTVANDFCVNDPWTYYYNPADPTELLFAIEHTPSGGNSNDFSVSVSLTVSSNPTSEAGVYSNEDIPNEQATFVMGRYFNITTTSGSLNGNVNIRFFYDTDEADTLEAVAIRWNNQHAGGTAFVSGLRWFAVNSGTFDPGSADLQPDGIQNSGQLTPTASSTVDGVNYVQFSVSSLTGGSLAYTVGNNSVILPVELLDFQATLTSTKSTRLTWSTAAEINSDRFEVERSADASSWEFLCVQSAAGFSSVRLDYEDIDMNPYQGVTYYRLRMIDTDGEEALSQIRSVRLNGGDLGQVMVYPNPNSGSFAIQFKDAPQIVDVEIVNSLGQVVRSITGSQVSVSHPLEVSGLAPGHYLVRFNSGSQVMNLPVIVTE